MADNKTYNINANEDELNIKIKTFSKNHDISEDNIKSEMSKITNDPVEEKIYQNSNSNKYHSFKEYALDRVESHYEKVSNFNTVKYIPYDNQTKNKINEITKEHSVSKDYVYNNISKITNDFNEHKNYVDNPYYDHISFEKYAVDKINNDLNNPLSENYVNKTKYQNEDKLKTALEMNRKEPNNPYGTIEDIINKKSIDENLSEAKEIMDNMNLNYKDSVKLYNKISKEIEIETDKLEQTDEYKNANSEQQSYQGSAVIDRVEEANGIYKNSNYKQKDILKLYAMKNHSNYLSNEIEQYQPNTNFQETTINKNDSTIENKETDLQKLKSVELEKNVIGLLPNEQQENNYKETLSRLEKNKSTLKDDLKAYMSNTKIDNAINSVKNQFQNVKVKAEDIQQTFKDLGQWNTDNKFVKNIDNVIDKVKNLSQKNDNKIDINDPKLLEKLQTKFKESNDYINSVDENNQKEDLLKKEKSNYLENTLNIANPQLLEQSHKITADVASLNETQKLGLYNFAKDVDSLTKDKNYSSYEDMKNNLDTIKITSQIENDLGKEVVDNRRLEYLVSDVKKPAILGTISDNQEHLNQFINKSNESIGNITRADLKNYQQNANGELDKIQQNKRANELRNNDLLKKFNNQKQENTQQEKPSNSQENKNELQQADKEEKTEKKQVNRGMNIQ
jgi:hypothetical protein